MTDIVFEVYSEGERIDLKLLKRANVKDLSANEIKRAFSVSRLPEIHYKVVAAMIARGLTIDILNNAEIKLNDRR